MGSFIDNLGNVFIRGNFIIAVAVAFILIVIPITGFNTIKTLVFESYNDNYVRYGVCTETDYDGRGSYCLEEDYVYTTFSSRIKNHFINSLGFWILAVIALFIINVLPKIIRYKNRNRLAKEDLEKLGIEKVINLEGDELKYKINILNKTDKIIRSVTIKFYLGWYREYDNSAFNFEKKIVKKGYKNFDLKVLPKGMVSIKGSFIVGNREKYISKKLLDEGWRFGEYDVWISHAEV